MELLYSTSDPAWATGRLYFRANSVAGVTGTINRGKHDANAVQLGARAAHPEGHQTVRRRVPLRCPSCGGAPRLPQDLRQEVRCACGTTLRVGLVCAQASPNAIPKDPRRCPSCGGTPRLPRDLRQRVRCACGTTLRVALVYAQASQAKQPAGDANNRHRFPQHAASSNSEPDALPDFPIARPFPIYRGRGAARERTWGAVVDTPVEPGDRVLIVARSGRIWQALVAEPRGSHRGGGYLVTLRGEKWLPAPDLDTEPDGRDRLYDTEQLPSSRHWWND